VDQEDPEDERGRSEELRVESGTGRDVACNVRNPIAGKLRKLKVQENGNGHTISKCKPGSK